MGGEGKEQPKRLKYNRVEEGWGEMKVVVVPGVQPYIPLPQRQKRRSRREYNPVTNQLTKRLVAVDIRKFVRTPEPTVKEDKKPRGRKRSRGEEDDIVEEDYGPFEEKKQNLGRRNRSPGEEEDRRKAPTCLNVPQKTPKSKQQTLKDWFVATATVTSSGDNHSWNKEEGRHSEVQSWLQHQSLWIEGREGGRSQTEVKTRKQQGEGQKEGSRP